MSIRFAFAALLLLIGACSQNARPSEKYSHLTILHFNDTHGHLAPFRDAAGKLVGGVARRTTYIRAVRAENPDLLVLQAGDILTGTVYSSIYHGRADIGFMNGWDQTATCVGNHELDYGVSNVLELAAAAHFPFLSANMRRKDGSALFPAYLCTNIAGASVCIAGVSISDDSIYNRDAVRELRFDGEAAALSNLLYGSKLRATNSLVILLTHVGVEADKSLAAAFPDVDLIVGGHSHTLLPAPVKIGNVLVVQDGQWGEYVGRLDWFLSAGRPVSNVYALAPMDASVAPDPAVAEAVSNMETKVKKEMDVLLGTNPSALSDMDVRDASTGLGNWIADAVAEAVPCDAACLNGGGIRSPLSSGPVSLLDVWTVLPFDDVLVRLTMKGSLLRRFVVQGAGNIGRGGFLQWSGAVRVRKQLGGWNVEVGGKPVDDDASYRIVVPDYLHQGGDGFTLLAQSSSAENTGLLMRDIAAAAVKKAGGMILTAEQTNARVAVK
jgi:2',3'-cyclic-nucleotide 2'-phosphodiesterase (5'-nucleotidase family)